MATPDWLLAFLYIILAEKLLHKPPWGMQFDQTNEKTSHCCKNCVMFLYDNIDSVSLSFWDSNDYISGICTNLTFAAIGCFWNIHFASICVSNKYFIGKQTAHNVACIRFCKNLSSVTSIKFDITGTSGNGHFLCGNHVFEGNVSGASAGSKIVACNIGKDRLSGRNMDLHILTACGFGNGNKSRCNRKIQGTGRYIFDMNVACACCDAHSFGIGSEVCYFAGTYRNKNAILLAKIIISVQIHLAAAAHKSCGCQMETL